MPLISAVIITLNEEKNIGKCLDSLKAVADEIVVVDSFSTDQTERVAKERGAKFIQNKFANYVTQHEFADKQASHDIILTIDADEVLSDELIDSIQKVKRYWRCDGYSMCRLAFLCG